MKTKVGPAAIVIAVVVLAGFCYFMYKQSQPKLQTTYDPQKYGPPAYVKNMKGGGPAGGGYSAPHGQPTGP